MPAVQYPDLTNSFGAGSFVGANHGLEQMFAAQRNEQLNQARAQMDQEYDSAQRPVSLANDFLKLQAAAREEDLAQKLYPGRQSNAIKKQEQESANYNIPQIEKFGNSLLQLGTMAKQNGGTLPLWMKSQIPDDIWKDIHSEGGPDRFVAHGKAIVENKDKFISQESKQGSALDIANIKAGSAEDVARINAAAKIKAAELATAKAKELLSIRLAKPDKLSYQNLATKLEVAADDLAMNGETEKAAYVRSRADEYRKKALEFPTAATERKVGSQEDLEAELGIRKSKPQAAPAAPAPTNDRVRVISPDGKVGTIPRSQLQGAMAQGYKESK